MSDQQKYTTEYEYCCKCEATAQYVLTDNLHSHYIQMNINTVPTCLQNIHVQLQIFQFTRVPNNLHIHR
jgi:hypothetical protein